MVQKKINNVNIGQYPLKNEFFARQREKKQITSYHII